MCPEAVRRTLATMLDMSLLKSPSFMLLAISGFLCMMGFFVPFMYLKSRAAENGWDKNDGAFLISAIGISNTVARILCGFLSSLESVDANLLSNIAITLGGVTTILSGFAITPFVQFSYALVFGLAIGESRMEFSKNDALQLNRCGHVFFFFIYVCHRSLLLGVTIDYCGGFDGH